MPTTTVQNGKAAAFRLAHLTAKAAEGRMLISGMASGSVGERHWHAARRRLWLNQEIAKAEIEASQTDSGTRANRLRH